MVNHALVSGMRGVLTVGVPVMARLDTTTANNHRWQMQDYDVLTTRLESHYLTSPDFTLQTAFLHLHPTLHVLSLLYSLCQALEDQRKAESDDDSSEDEDMANYLRDADGASQNKGIIGGEVLGVVVERASCMNG